MASPLSRARGGVAREGERGGEGCLRVRGVEDDGGEAEREERRNREVLHVSLLRGVLTPNSFFNVT